MSLTDAKDNVRSFTYDDVDRVVTARGWLLHDEFYEYDENGNLAQVTDRKSQITTFTYDQLDHLTQIIYADSSTTTYTSIAARHADCGSECQPSCGETDVQNFGSF